jgi:uncharacterized integral membrane protein (TIGR00698 family)
LTSANKAPTVNLIVWLLASAAMLLPWTMPWMALLAGAALALLNLAAMQDKTKGWSRLLIQCAVVLTGLTLDLNELSRLAVSGLAFALGTIVGVFALGWAGAKVLKTEAKLTTLLCSGTAICGGSAIAAVSGVINASAAATSVAIGVVFLMNAAALFVFPPLGHWLQLTDAQFGTWAAVAIHDVSSVVGAAKQFGGEETLHVATAVKLSRTLWIAPIAILAGWWFARQSPEEKRKGIGSVVPWFVLGFVIASALRTFVPQMAHVTEYTKPISSAAMTLALFWIGCGLSRKTLAAVGWRPLVLALTLWVFISSVSLLVIRSM